MNNKLRLVSTCLVVLTVCAPLAVSARDKKVTPTPAPAASAATAPAPKSERPIPFHGMISAVDARAKTFTIAGKEKSRVFRITGTTVLSKAGVPATMKDVVANEEARGSYWKRADGSLEAKSVKLGPLTPQEQAALDARKAKHEAKKKAADAASPEAPAVPKP